MLKIDKLNMQYPQGFTLKIDKIRIEPGRLIGIVGPNGSGKSTFLNCLMGFHKSFSGEIFLDNYNLKKLSIMERARMVSYHPQENQIRFPLPVFDTILMGRHPHSPWGYTKNDKELVYEIIDQFNLGKYLNVNFNELSGGEKQMVLLARSFVQRCKLMLFDEPNNNLDIAHLKSFMTLIQGHTKKQNKLSIMIMHDINAALKYCDSVLLFKEGEILGQINNGDELEEALFTSLYEVPVRIRTFENQKVKYIDTLV